MRLGMLLDSEMALRSSGVNLLHRRITPPWMVPFSLLVHLIFLGFFLLTPHLIPKPIPFREYPVSLISPKFLDVEQQVTSEMTPVDSPPPESLPALEKIPPLVKNAEVNIDMPKEIPKGPLSEKAISLPPAKFTPEPATPKVDTVVDVPPTLALPSSPKEVKAISLEVPVAPISPQKNEVGDRPLRSVDLSVGGTGTSPTGSAFGHPYYLSIIKNKIRTQWLSSPSSTSVKSARFIVGIGFTIKPDGHIESIVVEKSSGNTFFDTAAKRAIYNANPLPPLPSGISDALQVHFTFEEGLDS